MRKCTIPLVLVHVKQLICTFEAKHSSVFMESHSNNLVIHDCSFYYQETRFRNAKIIYSFSFLNCIYDKVSIATIKSTVKLQDLSKIAPKPSVKFK